ncbi:hypothetical protein ACIRVF_36755 [Kitasatospora sp. NPDC101157]|uniref:hypothetical protein n=1 Tax=Kitasatospora sp. NPDC101157 TaxID=3364098 RepID=UPI0037F6B7E8
MTTPADLARIDGLLADPHPFPPEDTDHATGRAGPGYRVEELYVSRAFFDGEDGDDDEDGQACDREHHLAQARLDALAREFTTRWGSPQAVDLFSYLRASSDRDHQAPEPVALLCQQAVTLHVWPLPGGRRWIGLSVGQADKELPVVLHTTLAEGPAPAPTVPCGKPQDDRADGLMAGPTPGSPA